MDSNTGVKRKEASSPFELPEAKRRKLDLDKRVNFLSNILRFVPKHTMPQVLTAHHSLPNCQINAYVNWIEQSGDWNSVLQFFAPPATEELRKNNESALLTLFNRVNKETNLPATQLRCHRSSYPSVWRYIMLDYIPQNASLQERIGKDQLLYWALLDKLPDVAQIYLKEVGILRSTKHPFVGLLATLLRESKEMDPNTSVMMKVLGFAFRERKEKLLKAILTHPRFKPETQQHAAIRWSSRFGHTYWTHTLLRTPDVNPGAMNDYALRWACENGHLKVVELLLQSRKVNPGARNNNPIRIASERGFIDIVRLLLQSPRVNPCNAQYSAIRDALRRGELEVVKLLLNDKRVVLKEVFFTACSLGDLALMKLLISKYDINGQLSDNISQAVGIILKNGLAQAIHHIYMTRNGGSPL